MLLIAGAFAYLNRVDHDCGTTFSWVTRAMGPWAGWIGGWAITMTGVLVIGSLAEVGVRFTLLTVGLDGWAESTLAVTGLTVALILLMAWICVLRHRALRAAAERADPGPDRGAGRLRRRRALRASTATARSAGSRRRWDWLNPFGAGGAALTGGLLLGSSRTGAGSRRSTSPRRRPTRATRARPGRGPLHRILLLTYLACRVRGRRLRRHRLAGRQRRRGGGRLRAARHARPWAAGTGWCCSRSPPRRSPRPRRRSSRPPAPPCRWPGARAAAPARAHPPAAPHPGRVHLVGRRHRDRLVPRRRPGQRERALRLAHRALPADRLLLRADRPGVRRLLPPAPAARAPRTCC